LEQVRWAGREGREAVGALDREVRALEVAARALDVAPQGLRLVVREPIRLARLAVGRVEERADLGGAGRGRRELRRIEVEEEAQHACAVGTEVRQPPEEVDAELVRLHDRDVPAAGAGDAATVAGRLARLPGGPGCACGLARPGGVGDAPERRDQRRCGARAELRARSAAKLLER